MPYPVGFPGRSILSADYHQQYLAKNPGGYCGIGGCGVAYSRKELAEVQKG
jgi:peptide methionine sulfoxide reductase MsrA